MRNREQRRLCAWIEYYGYEPGAWERKLEFYEENDPTHYKHLKRLMWYRTRGGSRVWRGGPDCNEIGITGTTKY
jgi:hypothetical protein